MSEQGERAPVVLGELPESLAPEIDLAALQAKLTQLLEEQRSLKEKQDELRTQLDEVTNACKEEDAALEELQGQYAEQQQEVEQQVAAECDPVDALAERLAPARERLQELVELEKKVWAVLAESEKLPDEAQQGMQAENAKRLVEDTSRRGEELKDETAQYAASSEELQRATDALAAHATSELEALEQLRRGLPEMQRALRSDEERFLEELQLEPRGLFHRPPSTEREALHGELKATEQASLQRAQALLGHVLKVAKRLSAPALDVRIPRPPAWLRSTPARELRCRRPEVRGWRRDREAALVAHAGAAASRRLRQVVLVWRLHAWAWRRQRQQARHLAAVVRPVDLSPIAARLEALEAKLRKLQGEKLTSGEFAASCSAHAERLASLRSVVAGAVEAAKPPPRPNPAQPLDDISRDQLAELERLEELSKADKLGQSAHIDDLRKVGKEVLGIWNEVKMLDQQKACARVCFDPTSGGPPKGLVTLPEEPATRPAREIVAEESAAARERILELRGEVDGNQEEFTRLEQMLAELASFVESMVQELNKLEYA